MPRLGSSRLSKHRLSNAPAIMRVAESHCSPVQTTSNRENSVSRTSTSFIPAEIDFEVGRISDARLGSHRLGGGRIRGIISNSSRDLELPRTSESFVDAIDTDADQTLRLPRTSESFVNEVETENDRGYVDWWIAGRMLQNSNDVELTPKTLTLSFEADRDDLEHWRQFDRSGNVQVDVGFGGAFDVIDRGGRDEPTTLEPPFRQRPPFDRADYYINSYQESQQAPDRFEISLTFQRLENRADVFDPVDEASEAWLLEFDRGTIALEVRKVRQTSTNGTTAGGTITLPVTVTDLQAATIADVAGYPDGVVEHEVPDGENFVEDTSGGRQTVAIEAPDGAGFESGTYYVQGWSLSLAGYDEDRWLVELELAKTE